MSGIISRHSLEHAVAGSTGTVLATLLLFPLERLKTLLQLEPSTGLGVRGVLLRVLREEGRDGLYRGCGPMLQTVGTSNFVYFFLFDGFKERLAKALGREEGEVGPYETLASSAIAGALNMILTEPLWRACVVAQARTRPVASSADGCGPSACCRSSDLVARGAFGTVRQMWLAEGLRALWRGLGSSLWLVLNPVIQFFVYDVLKAVRLNNADISSIEAFVMGAAAKALATVLTFPLQVAQSRLRNAKEASSGNMQRPELQGMVPCLRALLLENGIGGLYFGLLPKLVQTVTQAALMFAIYEKVHWAIRRASRKGMRRLMRRGRRRLR